MLKSLKRFFIANKEWMTHPKSAIRCIRLGFSSQSTHKSLQSRLLSSFCQKKFRITSLHALLPRLLKTFHFKILSQRFFFPSGPRGALCCEMHQIRRFHQRGKKKKKSLKTGSKKKYIFVEWLNNLDIFLLWTYVHFHPQVQLKLRSLMGIFPH